MPENLDGGNLRGNKGETANSVEGARNSSVLGDPPPKPVTRRRGKKAKAAPPPADPITDTDALHAAVHRAGLTPAQAVGWLAEQDEYVPGDDLTGTDGGQRRKLLDHLATLDAREVQA